MASALGNDPDAQVLKVRRLAAGGRLRCDKAIRISNPEYRPGPFLKIAGRTVGSAGNTPLLPMRVVRIAIEETAQGVFDLHWYRSGRSSSKAWSSPCSYS
jgi:hypothetical protein